MYIPFGEVHHGNKLGLWMATSIWKTVLKAWWISAQVWPKRRKCQNSSTIPLFTLTLNNMLFIIVTAKAEFVECGIQPLLSDAQNFILCHIRKSSAVIRRQLGNHCLQNKSILIGILCWLKKPDPKNMLRFPLFPFPGKFQNFHSSIFNFLVFSRTCTFFWSLPSNAQNFDNY